MGGETPIRNTDTEDVGWRWKRSAVFGLRKLLAVRGCGVDVEKGVVRRKSKI